MTGRSVLVTGATGGIGLETARGLARRGAAVTVLGRNPEKTARVAAEIGAAGTLIADLAEIAQVRQVVAEFRDRVGSLDVLVNNAG
ncbi:SDR family NAD(P)-dependent oxidoreductase, partial [Deinococcus saxicola]